jgi:RHS repeat-associated protein
MAGKPFPVTFANSGTQTVTMTDEFGNSDTVTIDVLAAVPAIPLPTGVAAYAVQWMNGHSVDYYVKNTSGIPLFVLEATTFCSAPGDPHYRAVEMSLPSPSYRSLPITIPTVNCWIGASGRYEIHQLTIVDGSGHKWALPATRYFRFSDVPGNANFDQLDEGDPLHAESVTVTARNNEDLEDAPDPLNKDAFWHVSRAGMDVTIDVHETVSLVGYSFPNQPSITQWAPEPETQFRFLVEGTGSYTFDNIPWACYFAPFGSGQLRLQYKDYATGRDGYRVFDIGDPGAAPEGFCDDPNDGRAYDINGNEEDQTNTPFTMDPFAATTWDNVWNAMHRAAGDPVDVFTGAQTASVTDFSLGGLSPALSLSRSYRSDIADMIWRDKPGAHQRPLLFGSGWASLYDLDLDVLDANRVSVRAPDGGYYQFVKDAAGTWISSVPNQQTLTQVSGGWKITDEPGSGFRFDTDGRLVAVFDATGRELALGYDASGDLATIEDPAGRTATVTTNAAGRITRIDLEDGRYVAYTYSADGYLASVRDLAGTVLAYDTDLRGRITAVRTAGDDDLLRNVYDDSGRVVVQYDAIARPTFLAYDRTNRIEVGADSSTTIGCYNERGLMLGEVNPLGAVTTRTYDPKGFPRTLTDPLGHLSRFVHDGQGHLTSVVDAQGGTTDVAYDSSGHPTTVSDATGTTTTAYVGGLPTSVTRTSGANSLVQIQYGFDPVSKLPTTVTTPGGAVSTNHYDSRGYLDYTLDAEGRKTGFVTNARGFITAVTSPAGYLSGADPADFTTTYTYDAMGRVLTMTDPFDATTTFTYDDMGRPDSVTTPLGRVTTYTYDLAGQLQTETVTLTATDDAVMSYEYDLAGNLAAVVDAEDRRTEFDHDLAGRLIATTDADGKVWQTDYDADGRATVATDPTGRTGSVDYDALDRIVAVTDSAGLTITLEYDPDGRLISVTDAADLTTSFGYDWLNRRTSVTDAKDQVWTTAFDDAGDPVSVTNARGKTTTYEFDLTHRLTEVTESGGIQTTYDYDDAGRLVTRTNARGATETYAYDALDRVTTMTDAADNAWVTAYDADGRVDHTIDGKAQTTEFGYDLAGRLLTVTPANGPAVTNTYDLTGRLTSMVDGNGTTGYAYDPVGRLTSVVRGGRTTGYAYDDAGRPTSVTYPGTMGAVTYGYDTAGRPETITDWADRVTTLAYDDDGRVESLTRPGDVVSAFTYDELYRPLTVSHVRGATPLLTQLYTYDPSGNVATLTDDTGSATMSYDDLDRLTDADYAGSDDYSYTYDDVGNLLSATTPAGTASYDLADRHTDTGFVYDDNGNLTADPGRTFAYDALGRLTGVTEGATTTTYELDGLGNRWAETSGGVTTDFDLDLSVPDPTVLFDGAKAYLPGQPSAGYELGGTWYSSLTDQLGSPVLAVSETGSTGSPVHYDPYGTARPGSSGSAGIGFAGEWRDPADLINLRARAYDPGLPRFVGRDTFGGLADAPQTANRYAYGLGNPLRYTDPSGHFVQTAINHPEEIVSTIIGLTTIPGLIQAGLNAALGYDPITGRALEPSERTLGAVLVAGGPGFGPRQ